MPARKKSQTSSGLPEEIQQILRQHPIFSHMRQINWSRMTESARVCEHGAGETICRESTPARTLWLVVDGEIKLVRHTTKGQVLLVDIMLPGEVFGAVFYTEHPVQPVSAITLKPTRLLACPLDILIDELGANQSLKTAFLEDTCLKLCQSIALRGLALEDLPIRIASILCRLEEKFGRIIPETRATLAELAGTTTESAIRVTREMEKCGVLRLRRGSIEIVSSKKLHRSSALSMQHIHSPIQTLLT